MSCWESALRFWLSAGNSGCVCGCSVGAWIKGHLFLGSPFNQYIAKVKLPENVVKSVKGTEAKEDQLI